MNDLENTILALMYAQRARLRETWTSVDICLELRSQKLEVDTEKLARALEGLVEKGLIHAFQDEYAIGNEAGKRAIDERKRIWDKMRKSKVVSDEVLEVLASCGLLLSVTYKFDPAVSVSIHMDYDQAVEFAARMRSLVARRDREPAQHRGEV